jgi:hypothetical protein
MTRRQVRGLPAAATFAGFSKYRSLRDSEYLTLSSNVAPGAFRYALKAGLVAAATADAFTIVGDATQGLPGAGAHGELALLSGLGNTANTKECRLSVYRGHDCGVFADEWCD